MGDDRSHIYMLDYAFFKKCLVKHVNILRSQNISVTQIPNRDRDKSNDERYGSSVATFSNETRPFLHIALVSCCVWQLGRAMVAVAVAERFKGGET